MWRIMEFLAIVNSNGRIPYNRLLNRSAEQLIGNSIVILITSAIKQEIADAAINLRKRGIQVLSILVDAQSFDKSISQTDILARLRSSNIRAYNIRKGDNLTEKLDSREIIPLN
jgi:hypothetical protein